MITHNGKQVTLAMRNRKAINLIARNGKAMFGEFEDWSTGGINRAAKAVILAEYGSVVWSDVRDYAKAHPAIVPFINQDPHLAASISPNSNKTRWLQSDKVGNYFNLGVILYGASTGVLLEYKMQGTAIGQDSALFGARSGYGSNDYSINLGAWGLGNYYIGYGKSYGDVKVPTDGLKHSVYINQGEIRYDDLSKSYAVANFQTPSPAWLFGSNGSAHYTSRLVFINGVKMWENNEPSHHFVPYRDPSTGEMELLDLVTATLATRVGTFTEIIEDKQ